MFHKEGYPSIALATVLLALCIWLGLSIEDSILKAVPIAFGAFIWVIILQFFRNPKRNTPNTANGILAPSDGRVVKIEPFTDHEYFGEPRMLISIFMSPLNVHVTRYPFDGTVRYSQYHPGKYLVAWHPKSSTHNERTTIVLEHPSGTKVLYRQIAGALARRIVNYAEVGQKVKAGTDAGFIKFGSRIDVIVPNSAKIQVVIDQKVRGGETIIAELVSE